jgi:hypothetical protein
MTTTDRTIESVDSMYSSMRSPYESSHAEVDMKLKSNAALDVTPEGITHFSWLANVFHGFS